MHNHTICVDANRWRTKKTIWIQSGFAAQNQGVAARRAGIENGHGQELFEWRRAWQKKYCVNQYLQAIQYAWRQTKLSDGLRIECRDLKLHEALSRYNDRISSQKKGFQQERYRANTIRRYPLAGKELSQINSVDIAEYRDVRLQTAFGNAGKTISPSTVRLELSLLSDLFTVAEIEWGKCTSNPVAKVRKPKIPPGRQRRLERQEEKKILRICEQTENRLIAAITFFHWKQQCGVAKF